MQDIIYETSQGHSINLMDISVITPVEQIATVKDANNIEAKTFFLIYFKGDDEPLEVHTDSAIGGSEFVHKGQTVDKGEEALRVVENCVKIEHKRLTANWRALLDVYYWGMQSKESPEPSAPTHPLNTEELISQLKLWAENREDAGYDAVLLHLAIKRIEATQGYKVKSKASSKELVNKCDHLEQVSSMLTDAVQWALGYPIPGPVEFSDKPKDAPNYWWRNELHRRYVEVTNLIDSATTKEGM